MATKVKMVHSKSSEIFERNRKFIIIAVPFNLGAGQNMVIWVDVFVPYGTTAGQYVGSYTVTSDQGSVQGPIQVNVWNFTLPLKPSIKTSFNACCGTTPPGVNEELLRNKIMPDVVGTSAERMFIDRYGLNAQDLGFFGGASFGHCVMSAPPSVQTLLDAKATHQTDVGLLYDYSGDQESDSGCTNIYPTIQAWARNLHRAGIPNLETQEPVPELYDDGSGTGCSAIDIWTMQPANYIHAQSFVPLRVTFVQQKGDQAWWYTGLVEENYSPKWEVDFLPINYRSGAGFIGQSLGLPGLIYWSVDFWSGKPWTDIEKLSGFPGEGVLVYPGENVGMINEAVPSMRLKYLRDGVEDYEYIQLLKNCGQGTFALSQTGTVGSDFSHWTSDQNLLESVRRTLGDKIAATGCAP